MTLDDEPDHAAAAAETLAELEMELGMRQPAQDLYVGARAKDAKVLGPAEDDAPRSRAGSLGPADEESADRAELGPAGSTERSLGSAGRMVIAVSGVARFVVFATLYQSSGFSPASAIRTIFGSNRATISTRSDCWRITSWMSLYAYGFSSMPADRSCTPASSSIGLM